MLGHTPCRVRELACARQENYCGLASHISLHAKRGQLVELQACHHAIENNLARIPHWTEIQAGIAGAEIPAPENAVATTLGISLTCAAAALDTVPFFSEVYRLASHAPIFIPEA